MERELGQPFDRDDGKYFSGLSTILVATIQEAKDRISQIEYVFCSQIYPDFQSRSKALEKSFSEAMKAAEDDWKKKERSYLLHIENLQLENLKAVEENKRLTASLELEKANVSYNGHPFDENSRNKKLIIAKVECLQGNVDELQGKLRKKTKEVDERKELQEELLKRVESKVSVILNKEELLEKHEREKKLLLTKLKGLEKDVEILKWDLDKKTKEVEEFTELHGSLFRMIESKASVIVNKTKQLSACEEREKELTAKLEDLEKNIQRLDREIRNKNDEVAKGREVQEELLRMIKSESSVNVKNRDLLGGYERKQKLLLNEIASLKERIDKLQEELRRKTAEVTEGRELQEKLLQKIESCTSEMMSEKEQNTILSAKLRFIEQSVGGLEEELRRRNGEVADSKKLQETLIQKIEINTSELLNKDQLLTEHKKERNLILSKLRSTEEKVDELQKKLTERNEEVAKERESQEKLLLEIDSKASEILIEKQKRREMVAKYKRLKSQYNFLLEKSGLTTENMLPRSRMEEETNSWTYHQDSIISQVPESEDPESSAVTSEMSKQKDNTTFLRNLRDDREARTIQSSNSHSPSASGFPVLLKPSINVQTGPLAGMKRPISYWRGTRSHQDHGGPDPHDDFLNTPLENAKEIMKNKAVIGEVHDFPVPAPKDMNFDCSDDETQDRNVNPSPGKQKTSTSRPKIFKYVEPVRKKAERETLKGVECKQCKKFYDAVLPDDRSKDGDNKNNFRCEHLDGVSRHRYRYVPPMTPEGFWNIGFDSEL